MKSLVAAPLIALFSMSASVPAVAPCMAGMQKAMEDGHFSGVIVCSPRDASFTLVGKTARGGYAIYDYRYRFLPPHGNVYHGGQRLLVFRGGNYLGQYGASPPPYASPYVQGSLLRFHGRAGEGTLDLDFSHGPPRRALIGGLETWFAR